MLLLLKIYVKLELTRKWRCPDQVIVTCFIQEIQLSLILWFENYLIASGEDFLSNSRVFYWDIVVLLITIQCLLEVNTN